MTSAEARTKAPGPTDPDIDRSVLRCLEIMFETYRGIAMLDPRSFFDRIAELRRGGIAGQTDGARSAETPLPLPDRHDRWLDRRRTTYETGLRKMRDEWRTVKSTEQQVLEQMAAEEASRLAAEQVSPRAEACVNCRRVVERTDTDRLRAGRCNSCYQYRRDNDGRERPKELWVT